MEPVPRAAELNVLLITIDTLRADAVGAYNLGVATTPWIDRLAAGGARFTNAHAHNVVTLPSHANILSGRLPPEHGVRDNAGFRFPANIDTLATLLKAQGYDTGAFVSAFPLESRFGLARGFDVYDDLFAETVRPAFLIQERNARETVASAQRWLASRGDRPWLCWVHVYEPHFPYAPPEPFASRFPGQPYLGEVATADAALAPLLEPVLASGRNGRTMVVLTSDHGESLGEHGEATHGVFAYEAALKVPLVAYHPRLFEPRVSATAASHVDLLPTILDALTLAPPAGLAGRSLLPALVSGQERERPVYFEALSASLNRGWAPLDGVIRGSLKYIDLPIPELYDLATDPREERNLASSQAARTGELREVLRQQRGASAPVARLAESADTRERLRSLGYVGSSAAASERRYTESDDPKRLIDLDTLLHEIVGLYLEGDLSAALSRGRELVARRPDMPLSLLQLAQLERDSGNLAGGIEALRKAVAIAPGSAEMVAMLGAYLTQAGRASEAVALLEPYATGQGDVEVITSFALALAKLGRSEEALSALTRARERDPSNAMLSVEIGTVRLMAGDRAGARADFETALATNARVARAHSSLGVLDLEQGRADRAVSHWAAATAIDPREFETVLALGLSLGRGGRTSEARVALEYFASHAPAARYQREVERVRGLLAQLR